MNKAQIKQLVEISKRAGEIALAHFKAWIKITDKADKTPVTQADIEVSDFLIQELPKIVQGDVYSEEKTLSPQSDYLRSIDPIDGTRDFVIWKPERAVMIGLVHKTQWPQCGIIYHPKIDTYILWTKATWLIKGIWEVQEKIELKKKTKNILYKNNALENTNSLLLLKQRYQNWRKLDNDRPEWYLYTRFLTEGYNELILWKGYSHELVTLAGLLSSTKKNIYIDGKILNTYQKQGKLEKMIHVF